MAKIKNELMCKELFPSVECPDNYFPGWVHQKDCRVIHMVVEQSFYLVKSERNEVTDLNVESVRSWYVDMQGADLSLDICQSGSVGGYRTEDPKPPVTLNTG
jgi:hypothetical protein